MLNARHLLRLQESAILLKNKSKVRDATKLLRLMAFIIAINKNTGFTISPHDNNIKTIHNKLVI